MENGVCHPRRNFARSSERRESVVLVKAELETPGTAVE